MPSTPVESLIARFATGQRGLVTVGQLRRAGCSRQAIARRVARGSLERVHPGVLRIPGSDAGTHQWILAAVLACGGGALASHRSAAVLWGAEIGMDEVDVTIGRDRRAPRLERVAVHRPRDRVDLRPVRRGGIPTTSALRTLVDLGAVASAADVTSTLDHLIATRVVSLDGVRSALARHRTPGRAGIMALAAALDRLGVGADSEFERRFARLITEHGLPAPVLHHMVTVGAGRVEVDFAYPVVKLAIELDGFRWHGGATGFERDRARDADLLAAGWVVLRFTWRHVVDRPAWVAGCIRDVLAARRPAA